MAHAAGTRSPLLLTSLPCRPGPPTLLPKQALIPTPGPWTGPLPNPAPWADPGPPGTPTLPPPPACPDTADFAGETASFARVSSFSLSGIEEGGGRGVLGGSPSRGRAPTKPGGAGAPPTSTQYRESRPGCTPARDRHVCGGSWNREGTAGLQRNGSRSSPSQCPCDLRPHEPACAAWAPSSQTLKTFVSLLSNRCSSKLAEGRDLYHVNQATGVCGRV